MIRWAAGTLALLLVGAIVAGSLVRWRIVDPALRATVARDIAAASGLKATLGGTLALRLLPRPRLEADNVTMQGADGAITLDAAAMAGTLGLSDLLQGRLRVVETTFDEPTIAVDVDRLTPLLAAVWSSTRDRTDGDDGPPPLGFLHTEGLTLRAGVIRLMSQDPRRDLTLTDVWAKLAWPDDASPASLAGGLRWRGTSGTLALAVTRPADLLRGRETSADLRLASPLLDLAADGTLALGATLRATGRLAASSDALPAFLRTAGTPAPELAGITRARLGGEATLADGVLAISDVRLGLDDMLFEGALAFHERAGRPGLAGTLATERIDLGAFLQALPDPLAADGGWNALAFDTASVADDDIDLRISASRARLGRLEVEDGGLSLQSGNGRMELSLGEARAYDGLFKGRAVVRLNGDVTEVRADATVSQFDLKELADGFDMARQLTGTTSGHVTLEGRGRSAAEIVASLVGRGQISVRDGDIGPELVARVARQKAPPLDPSLFDSALVGFDIAHGRATLTTGWVLHGDARSLLTGSVTLPDQSADVTAHPPQPGTAPALTLAGPWRALHLDSAAAPTVDPSGIPAP